MAEKAGMYAKKPEQKQTCQNSCKSPTGFNNSGSSAEMILRLQRTAGNQAVQRLIRSGVLQAKLKIGQPHDMYEQEADRVAEQVMRMQEPQVQRKCAKCNEDEEKVLKPKAIGSIANTVPPIVHEVLSTPGQPLDTQTRSFMEPRFGHDFGNIRVHADAKAAESARAVNALAYTVGRDIILGEDQINSGTWQGKRLLAHELAHVVQQEYGLKQIQRQVGSYPDECEDRGPANSEDHPLIYNCQETNSLGRPERERCKRPAVGHAQQLLNEFLRKYDNWKSGAGGDTIACAGGSSAKIEALRNTLPSRLKVDCWFGDLTYKATRMFQLCDGGLKDDGKIGEKTWPALEIVGTTGSPPGKSPPIRKKPPVIPKVPPVIPKVPPGPIKPPDTPDNYCKPYSNITAAWLNWHQVYRMMMIFTNRFGSDIQDLWKTYLKNPKSGNKGTLPPRRLFHNQTSRVVTEFRQDIETVKQTNRIMKLIANRVRSNPALMPQPAHSSPIMNFRDVLSASEVNDLPMTFENGDTRIPGNIAGGYGKNASDAGDDVRNVDGKFIATNLGSSKIRIRAYFVFDILDCIDFCPGNPGNWKAQIVTIPMSRFEATTDFPTYDVPFEVIYVFNDEYDD